MKKAGKKVSRKAVRKSTRGEAKPQVQPPDLGRGDPWDEVIKMGLMVVESLQRLGQARMAIEHIVQRTFALKAQGKDTCVCHEITCEEIREIYGITKGSLNGKHRLEVIVAQGRILTDPPYTFGPWYVHIKKGVQGFRMGVEYPTKAEADWYAHMLRLALMRGDAGKTQDILRDAGLLIRRLLHKIKKDNPALPQPKIIAQTENWLQRHGMRGSILREDEAAG